jgi:hypothetical protein
MIHGFLFPRTFMIYRRAGSFQSADHQERLSLEIGEVADYTSKRSGLQGGSMGFYRTRVLCTLVFIAFLLAAPGISGGPGAQVLSFGRQLFHVRSQRFDIHFPRELEAVALRLLSFADGEKEKLESLYGRDSGYPIPVLLCDEFPDLNGYSTSFPSDRIVIFVAATGLGGSMAGMDDSLRSVFVHELTHSLNFRSRSHFWEAVSRLAGDAVSPAMWLMPDAIVEGSAVFSESLGGSGRNHDPASGEIILQAAVERRFPTFFQLSGAWDSWNSGSIPYIFGGSFIDYLVETYGADKLEALWKIAGQGELYSGFGGTAFGTGVFRDVFRLSLREVWKAYAESRAIPEPEPLEAKRIRERPSRIVALCASGRSLFLADAETGSLSELDVGTGKERSVIAADGSVQRIDISPDGTRILVSWREDDGRARSIPSVMTFLRDSGQRAGAPNINLKSAAWCGAGMASIRDSDFRSALVLPDGSELGGGRAQNAEVAANPDSGLASIDFDNPVVAGDGLVFALARRGGRTAISRIDLVTKRVDILDAELGQVRSLSAARGGEILASFTLPGQLARLAILAGGKSEPALKVQSRDISGGVHLPVMTDSGEVFYAGRFVGGEYLCSLPAEILGTMSTIGSAWIEVGPADIVEAADSAGASDVEGSALPAPAVPLPEVAPAFPLLFRTLRLPLLDASGFGVFLQGRDLTERLSWQLSARFDWRYAGFPFALNLSAASGPLALNFTLEDRFSSGGSKPGSGIRVDSAGISAAWRRSFAPARRRVDLSAALALSAIAQDLLPGGAYTSSWTSRYASLGIRAGYSDWLGSRYPPFAWKGFSAALVPETEILLESGGRVAFSLSARLRAAVPFAGMEFSLSGSLSPDASVAFGPVSRRLFPDRDPRPSSLDISYPAFAEYGAVAATSPWYATAEASARLFSAEIQKELPIPGFGTPLYLRRLTGRIGARLAAFDEGSSAPDPAMRAAFPASVFFRTEAQFAPTVSTSFIASLRPGVEISFATDSRLAPEALRLAFSLSVIQ